MPRETKAARAAREAREREAHAQAMIALDAQVTLGGPFLPYGASVTVSCKLANVASVLDVLHRLAREMEPHWGLKPHETPQADHVAGGAMEYTEHEDFDARRRRLGFRP